MKWLLTTLTFLFFTFSNPLFSQTLTTYFEKKEIEPKASPDGFFFNVEKDGKGAKAKKGDYVKISYKGTLIDGTEFDASEDEPFVFRVGYRQVILGWDLGVQEFQKGGKGQLYIPSKLGYGKKGIAEMVPANADLVYEIELLDIMDSKQYNAYMKEVEAKEKRKYEEHVKKQFAADKKIIQKYALKNKLKTKRMPSGVSYVLKKKGKGETAKAGDVIEVHYEGQLTNGDIFDSNFDKEPFKFVLGKGKTIQGWEDALKNFKKGSEGWLLIPSKLAYGPRSIREGKINIPENSVLIFKIKVVTINGKKK